MCVRPVDRKSVKSEVLLISVSYSSAWYRFVLFYIVEGGRWKPLAY